MGVVIRNPGRARSRGIPLASPKASVFKTAAASQARAKLNATSYSVLGKGLHYLAAS